MADKFEEYIKNNRELFDGESPEDQTWIKIEGRLDKKTQASDWSSSQNSMIWKIAAVVFLTLSAALLVDKWISSKREMPAYYAEFKQAESFYTTLISEKRNEIAAYRESEITKEFLNDIDRLDRLYADLKQTLQKEAKNEKVVNAMIKNLQLRMKILNQQILILEKLKEQQNENQKDRQEV